MTQGADKKVILFDGVCNLCNAVVAFLIHRDRKDVFRFAALQSEAGAQLAERLGLAASDLSSVVLLEGDRAFTKSTAALRILRGLPWYRVLYPLVAVPPFIRDAVYDWVARNRYGWFGKRDACMVPSPEVRGRFLD
jgi:predicted DCC family thiol-disulfide oxidoreductase YuxK